MPAVVVFLIFVICLILAIPVSISLGIASVLPGAVDPSFTASGTYVIRSMLEESTVSLCLQFRCSYFQELSWHGVGFQENYLMYLLILWEREPPGCHVQWL